MLDRSRSPLSNRRVGAGPQVTLESEGMTGEERSGERDVAGIDTPVEDRGFFHRYVGLPFETLVLQGSSTRQLTYAVAIGVTFGLFPIMGFSIPLCFIGALVFKAPQPLTHGINYAVYPLQIPLIFVFVRIGEWIMGAPNVSLSPAEIIDLTKTDWVRFVEEFGLTCLHAVLAWTLFAPVIFVGTFSLFRPWIAKWRDRHRAARGL